jgi:hypothetical protein
MYDKTEITFFEKERRIEIKNINFLGKERQSNCVHSFYLEDLDPTTLVYDLFESPDHPGELFLYIQMTAKEGAISQFCVNDDKTNKFYVGPYQTNYSRDILRPLPTSGKSFSKNYAEKLIENYSILFGNTGYKRAKLWNISQ